MTETATDAIDAIKAAECISIKEQACKKILEFFSDGGALQGHIAKPLCNIVEDPERTYDIAHQNGSTFMSVIAFDLENTFKEIDDMQWTNVFFHVNRLLSDIPTTNALGMTTFKIARSAEKEFEMIVTLWFYRHDYINKPFEELQEYPNNIPFMLGCTH